MDNEKQSGVISFGLTVKIEEKFVFDRQPKYFLNCVLDVPWAVHSSRTGEFRKAVKIESDKKSKGYNRDWLRYRAASFCEEDVFKLISRLYKCLNSKGKYSEKRIKVSRIQRLCLFFF